MGFKWVYIDEKFPQDDLKIVKIKKTKKEFYLLLVNAVLASKSCLTLRLSFDGNFGKHYSEHFNC